MSTQMSPLDPQREEGIRLWTGMALHGAHHDMATMMADLLDEITRLRSVEQGLRTEVSVHERRVRASSISMLTESEENMLRFCVDAGYQVYVGNSGTFGAEEQKAMHYLRDTFGLS